MTTFHFNAFKKVKAQMSYQNLGRDVPNPPNHAAAVKLAEEEGMTYCEGLQRTGTAQEWTYSGLPLSSVRGGPTGKISCGETIIHQIDKPTAERLIAAHNAAIAAEREKWKSAIKDYQGECYTSEARGRMVQQLRSQLEELRATNKQAQETIQQLRSQLAQYETLQPQDDTKRLDWLDKNLPAYVNPTGEETTTWRAAIDAAKLKEQP